MKNILLFIILFSGAVNAQTGKESFDFTLLYYLQGKWIIETNNKNIHEEWTKVNDSLLTSISFYVKNGDTTNAETVRLEKTGEDIFYIPTVEHNPADVKFKLTELTETKAVFVNPKHDFPTKIIYEKKNDNSINARIEGKQNGRKKGIDYPFKRVE